MYTISDEQRDKIKEFFDEYSGKGDMMVQFAEEMEQRNVIVDQIMKDDPKLGLVPALIIAGDKMSYDKAWKMLEAGIEFDHAVHHVGSFYRLQFAHDAMKAGYTTREHILEDLESLWRDSDPDDTKPEYFALWMDKYHANGNQIIYDTEKELKANQKVFTIFRGQDEDGTLGIAWTTDIEVAQRFAAGAGTRQRNRQGIVYKAKIKRQHILAYLTGRNESEVIVNPFYLIGT